MRRALLLRSSLVGLLAFVGCKARDEVAPVDRMQTVGLRLEVESRVLEVAVNLPESADAKRVVEALSGALSRTIRDCSSGADSLQFDEDRVFAARLRGTAIEQVTVEAARGTACLVKTLEGRELPHPFDPPLDVHVLLRASASP